MDKPKNTVLLGENPNGATQFLSSEGASRFHELAKVDKVQHDTIAQKFKKRYGSSAIDNAFRQGTEEKAILEAHERSKRPKLNPVNLVDPVDPGVPSGGKRRRLGRSQKRYNVSGHYTKRRGNKKRNTKRRGLSRRRRRGTHRK
jgi:hypothetical protein